MTTLGVVARADNGGLGAQTYEMCRWMEPDRILVALVGHTTRGTADLSRFAPFEAEGRQCYVPSAQDAAWLAECDVIWSAETWYGHHIIDHSKARGRRLVLHGNPEMGIEPADSLWLPTPWLQARYPSGTVVPFPVSRDTLVGSPVPMARTFYHVATNATEDRNGTRLVLGALPFVRNACRLLLRGPANHPMFQGAWPAKVGNVEISWLGESPALYSQAWPRCDVLLMPRRFGGLCLPVQEAWAQQIPAVMLDLEPYRTLIPDRLLVPARSPRDVRVKGGWFQVYDADPQDLAAVMDDLIEDPDLVQEASAEADLQAKQLDWAWWKDGYAKLLDRSPVPG